MALSSSLQSSFMAIFSATCWSMLIGTGTLRPRRPTSPLPREFLVLQAPSFLPQQPRLH
jgi:hypothetical protein